MLERCCEVAVYIAGGAVGFYSGDIRNLVDDYKALRPTITPSVPRLLNRVYDKVTSAVNGSAIKKLMLKMALASKKSELERFVVICFVCRLHIICFDALWWRQCYICGSLTGT